MNDFQALLARERNKRNLSVRRAAEWIGISHTYLIALERGVDTRGLPAKKPTPDVLRLISKAYEISYSHLMSLCGYAEEAKDLADIDRIYLRLAREAQDMKLDEDDIDQILAIYKRHNKRNET